jgi:predicted Zn-dependent protease
MKQLARALALLVGSAITIAGAAETPPAAPVLVAAAPEAEQIYLQGEFLFVQSPEIQDYLDTLIDKLLQSRTEKFTRPHLLIHSTGDFDARSDTEGNILITTETLRSLESEDELAALLGHELAHVVLHHPARKSLVQSIPIGVESMNAIAAAGDQLVQAQKQNTATPSESHFVRQSSLGTQTFSEFWSDLLAPYRNRDDENEADRAGFDMMRAAGYDPAAFTTLFLKLHAAQLKRGKRMEALRQQLLARAQKPEVKTDAAAGTTEGDLAKSLNGLKDAVSAKVVNGAFDGFAKMTADYDSPEKRQESLTKYAARKGEARRDKTPRSARFAAVLRDGPGGALLTTDATAQRLMLALQTGDEKAATDAAAAMLPKDPDAKPAGAKKPGRPGKPAKPKDAGKDKVTQVAKSPPPASPHLNLALAQWFEHAKQPELAEQRLGDWLAYPHAPSLAFVQLAGYRAARADFGAAIAALEDGERRIGTPKPFLPALVSVAKAQKNDAGAEAYTRRCHDEDTKSKSITGKVVDLFKSSPVPTGLYADCVARLGHMLADVGTGNANLSQAPAKAVDGITNSLKDGK